MFLLYLWGSFFVEYIFLSSTGLGHLHAAHSGSCQLHGTSWCSLHGAGVLFLTFGLAQCVAAGTTSVVVCTDSACKINMYDLIHPITVSMGTTK